MPETEKTAPAEQAETAAPEPPEQAEKTEKPEKAEKKTGKAKLAETEEALAAKQKELDALTDQHMRLMAEYANYKRRTEQEKEQIGAFTKAELLKGLLTAVDNMERAVASPEGPEYKAGVDLVMRQFFDALHKLGLEEIDAENAPFDPNLHNAVMREDADDVEPDTVTAVFQKGYKVGDRVLRPAMVKVAN